MILRIKEGETIISEIPYTEKHERTLKMDVEAYNLTAEIKRTVEKYDDTPLTLNQKRDKAIALVQKNTRDLLESFEYDGHTFSLNINKLLILKGLADGDLLDPTTPLSTVTEEKYLLSKENAMAFIKAGYDKYSYALTSGTNLKQDVLDMTEQQLDDFEDNR